MHYAHALKLHSSEKREATKRNSRRRGGLSASIIQRRSIASRSIAKAGRLLHCDRGATYWAPGMRQIPVVGPEAHLSRGSTLRMSRSLRCGDWSCLHSEMLRVEVGTL